MWETELDQDTLSDFPTTRGFDAATDSYIVFAPEAKHNTTQPYSATADFDGDGISNVTEAQNVLAREGTAADFAVAASDPDLDGTQSAGCFGSGPSGTSGSGASAIPLLLVALVLWFGGLRRSRA